MESSKHDNNIVLDEEEDFLEVDAPINGQKYCLLSFVSPEKMLKQKELFTFHKYLKHQNTEVSPNTQQNGSNSDLPQEKGESQKSMKTYDVSYKEFKKSYDNFLYSHQEDINSEFNEMVDFRTSVRGLKVRGVYETYREAKVKAARLQRVDRTFHVFIGQVGYWLPWDPEPDNIEDQEYLNKQLNNLVHEYQKNQEYRDEVFGDRVQNSKEEAIRDVEEHQKKNDELAKKTNEEDNCLDHPLESTKVISLEDTKDVLQADDPWMQRKKNDTEAEMVHPEGPTVLEI